MMSRFRLQGRIERTRKRLRSASGIAGYQVFYDRYEEAALWGENLPERFHKVYGSESRFVVMFVSQHYANKVWTTHERRVAQERAFKEPNRAYILPVIVDRDVEIPGLPLTTTGYVDIERGVDHIATLLLEKLGDIGS